MGRIDAYPAGTGLPAAMLGYSQVVANQTGIGGSDTDLTGLTVTVTVPAGRTIRILGYAVTENIAAAVNWSLLKIKEGAAELQTSVGGHGATAGIDRYYTHNPIAVIRPTAGTHTYKLTLAWGTGTGNLSPSAGPRPAFLMAEDITGSVWPTGSPVTAALIANEAFGNWTPVITQGVTPTQTVNFGRYLRFGNLIHIFGSVSFTGAGTAGQVISVTNLPIPFLLSGASGGTFRYFDVGNTNFCGTVVTSGTSLALFHDGDGNALGAGSHTIANADVLQFDCWYEAA
jgi:hypothetical protein